MRVGAVTAALWMALTGLDRHPSGPVYPPCGPLCGRQCGRSGLINGTATKSQRKAFRSIPKHSEAFRSILKRFNLDETAPAITAHNYPWRACRADFTTVRGGQGSLTAKRRAAGAALTAAAWS